MDGLLVSDDEIKMHAQLMSMLHDVTKAIERHAGTDDAPKPVKAMAYDLGRALMAAAGKHMRMSE
jgi:hypothetical protein